VSVNLRALDSFSSSVRRVRAVDFGALDQLIYEGSDGFGGSDLAARRFEWIVSAVQHQLAHSPHFRRLSQRRGFDADRLRSPADYAEVPLLSSGTFKHARVANLDAVALTPCRSSGTRGTESLVLRDRTTMERFVGTMLHMIREFCGHVEVRQGFVIGPPTNEAGDLWFSYVLSLVELLYDTRFFVRDDEFQVDDLYRSLAGLEHEAQPMIVTPPGLLLDFLQWMDERRLRLDLRDRHPYVITTGGWKKRENEAVSREVLEVLAEELLGVPRANFRDAYGMVELNSVVFECEAHGKHPPPWLEVVVRRPRDLSVASPGEEGLLTFLDPTPLSYPGFLASEDLGSLHDGCACGRPGPTLKVARRLAGIEERGCALKMQRYSRGAAAAGQRP
jgi:long-chain-fatty-acid---luciferin-component ligase